MGRGKAAAVDKMVGNLDLPSGVKYIQWRVENIDEVAQFLEPFVCRIRKVLGDQIIVVFPGGGNLQLSPGDCLVIIPKENDLQTDKLGVIHAKTTPKYRELETLNGSHLQH